PEVADPAGDRLRRAAGRPARGASTHCQALYPAAIVSRDHPTGLPMLSMTAFCRWRKAVPKHGPGHPSASLHLIARFDGDATRLRVRKQGFQTGNSKPRGGSCTDTVPSRVVTGSNLGRHVDDPRS